ncbi:Imm50 family immunity protein [Thauera linaloolentis]|uniref:Imm50 family immunity protein n=1 Tax=Thauera linaloolentis TaxID=76112 RepID=UPI0009D96FCA|nr:Imm50 family immunity protein [Thauera linaloolentis]MCM8565786.1 immunity 50 family protein [Thauera linaloolentis]
MTVPTHRIENAEAVTSLFGYWPSFHDAEVLELALNRDGASGGRVSLVARVHVFEMTNQVKTDGYFLCHKHSLVTLEFEGVDEVVIEGFNHQNALSELSIAEKELNGQLAVAFEGAFGVDASLVCRAVRVVSIVHGIPPGSVYSREKA